MKKKIVCINFAVLLGMIGVVHATVLNGSFESGGLDGWSSSLEIFAIPDGSSTSELYTFPVSISPWFEPSIESINHYEAIHGKNYLEVHGNIGLRGFDYQGVTYSTDGVGIITVCQELSLNTGDTLFGWIALYTEDYPPYDYDKAVIEISNSILYEPISISVMDAYGSNWPVDQGYPQKSDWTYWEWKVPTNGIYTLSLKNYMDDQEESVACFDGIGVYQSVPEPSTIFLLGIALFNIFIVNRVKFR